MRGELIGYTCSVNAHAEELRGYFVAHADQRRLVVEAGGNRYTADFGRMSRDMTQQIHKNVGGMLMHRH